MTDMNHPSRTSFSTTVRRSLLAHGLGVLGGVGLLSSPLAIAQEVPPADSVVVPSAQDLLLTPTGNLPEPEPLVIQAPEPVPIAPIAAPAPQPAAPRAQTPPVVEDAPAVSLPTHIRDLAADNPGNVYIDTTDYSLGATPGYSQPSSIVLSERSTGCQQVLQAGQNLPASLCPVGQAAGNAGQTAAGGNPNPQFANAEGANAYGGVNSINIGPVTVSASGIRVGNTTPNARDYYNRTIRPSIRLGNGNSSLMFPLSIPTAITSAFGWRIHPISGTQRFHAGTDLGAPMGTPVLAAFSGQVATADFLQGYGLTVILQHDSATKETLYAHLSEIFVQPDEWVEQGTVIGRVGSTGMSTGPHLHFEYREMTSQGWLAMDAGELLNYALANLFQSPQTAAAPEAKPQTVLTSSLTAPFAWSVSSLKGVAVNLGKTAKFVATVEAADKPAE